MHHASCIIMIHHAPSSLMMHQGKSWPIISPTLIAGFPSHPSVDAISGHSWCVWISNLSFTFDFCLGEAAPLIQLNMFRSFLKLPRPHKLVSLIDLRQRGQGESCQKRQPEIFAFQKAFQRAARSSARPSACSGSNCRGGRQP